MITFFRAPSSSTLYIVESHQAIGRAHLEALTWLFGGAVALDSPTLSGIFIGTRRELITP